MECPKCNSEIGKARYCGCGWKQAAKSDPMKSAGVGNCEWISNGERCHYPGTISHNTQGLGPWFCHFHSQSGISAHYGEQIVNASRDYKPSMMEERDASHLRRLHDPQWKPALRACEERRCLKPATLHTNGRYLCPTHRETPDSIQYARRGPDKGRAEHAAKFEQAA